jgi:hypothetical protein
MKLTPAGVIAIACTSWFLLSIHDATAGFCAQVQQANAAGLSAAPGSPPAMNVAAAAGLSPARYERLFNTAKALSPACRYAW